MSCLWVRRLQASRRGNIATLTALMMPVLIGSAGLASDSIQWTLTKRMMQRAADSGAIAGAFQLSQSSSISVVRAAATGDINRNDGFRMTITPVINSPATSGSFRDAASAVEVILATDMNLPFTGLIMRGPMRISARAVAEVVGNGDYCVLALENTNTPGIPIGGSATVNLGCGMMSNAPSNTSIIANGASSVTASPVAAVGLVPPGNYTTGTVRESYALPLRDPYRNLPDPINISNSNNDLRVQPNRSSTFSAGTYRNIDVSGTATFNPGVYYVTGSVNFGSQANVTASGAVSMQGGARLNMTAPSTGTYAGILFYQDRRASNMATNIINGNSSSVLQGALYFPRQELQMNGTSGMNTRCIQIVARRVDWRGNTAIQNVCPANSGASSFKGTQIKLVA